MRGQSSDEADHSSALSQRDGVGVAPAPGSTILPVGVLLVEELTEQAAEV